MDFFDGALDEWALYERPLDTAEIQRIVLAGALGKCGRKVVIPVLTISAGPGPGMATVAWQPDQPGWKLQQAATPNPVVWHDAPTGSANPVVVPMGSQPGFFRVFKR